MAATVDVDEANDLGRLARRLDAKKKNQRNDAVFVLMATGRKRISFVSCFSVFLFLFFFFALGCFGRGKKEKTRKRDTVIEENGSLWKRKMFKKCTLVLAYHSLKS